MKNSQKVFKRIMSLALAVFTVFAMTSMSVLAAEPAQAAEVTESAEVAKQEVMTNSSSSVDTLSSDEVVATGMATIVNSATITLQLTQSHWNAGFYITVLGNQGAKYEVVLTMPNGSQKVAYVAGGSSNLSTIAYTIYAEPGTYEFEFTRISGNAASARAIAEIHE